MPSAPSISWFISAVNQHQSAPISAHQRPSAHLLKQFSAPEYEDRVEVDDGGQPMSDR